MPWLRGLAAMLLLTQPPSGGAVDIHVAVASNFAPVFAELADLFTRTHPWRVTWSAGSTGKLYAQVLQGAPFELFLAADAERPQLLEETGMAVAGSRFTYAVGRLVLWSGDSDYVDPQGRILESGEFRHLAMANPKTAPYGAAAREVLVHRGLLERLAPRLVYGENVAQTYQFVSSGNAELGFVARSQLGSPPTGSWWEVPASLHAEIAQQAVLLRHAGDRPGPRALLAFLRGAQAAEVVQRFGYDSPAREDDR